MGQKISLEKALEMVMEELKAINIPVKYINEIGVPIANSVNNLNEIIKAVIRDQEKQNQENRAKEKTDSDIEVVEVGTINEMPGSVE